MPDALWVMKCTQLIGYWHQTPMGIRKHTCPYMALTMKIRTETTTLTGFQADATLKWEPVCGMKEVMYF